MTAAEVLARKSGAQLLAGLERARVGLQMIDHMEQEETPGGDGPFPPTKAYELYTAQEMREMRRLYQLAISQVNAELARRRLTSTERSAPL